MVPVPVALKRHGALAAGLVAACVYLLFFLRRVAWMGDDGYFITHASRILAGQIPYRDFFTHITPGCYYLLALALKVCDSWTTTRVLWLALVLVQAAAVFVLARRLTESTWAAMAGFLFVVAPAAGNPVYNHHHLSAALALGSTFAWWSWLQTGRRRWAMIAGLADGAVFWTMQSKGALLIVASIAAVALLGDRERRERWRSLGLYAVGGALATLPFVPLVAASWSQFAHDCFGSLAEAYVRTTGTPYGGAPPRLNGLKDVVRWLATCWFVYGSVVGLIVESVLFFRDRRGRQWTGLIMLQGWALWGSALHWPDGEHLMTSAHLPTVLLVTHLWTVARWRSSAANRRALGWGGVAVLSLFLACTAWALVLRVRDVVRRPSFVIAGRRDRAWTPSQDLADTVNALAERPTEGRMFVFPHSSLYYRFLDRANPTRYDLLIEWVQPPSAVREVIDVLERERVETVLVDTAWNEAWIRSVYPTVKFDTADGEFMRYVHGRYEVERVLPSATVYRRR